MTCYYCSQLSDIFSKKCTPSGMTLIVRDILNESFLNLNERLAHLTAEIFKNDTPNATLAYKVIKDLTLVSFQKKTLSAELKKKILLDIFKGVHEFLSDLNQSLKEMSERSEELMEADEELLMVQSMNEKIVARGFSVIVSNSISLADMQKSIFEKIESMLNGLLETNLSLSAECEAERKMLIFMLSTELSRMLSEMVTADGLNIVIDLLGHIFSLPIDPTMARTEEECEFTKMEVAHLSDAKDFVHSLTEIFCEIFEKTAEIAAWEAQEMVMPSLSTSVVHLRMRYVAELIDAVMEQVIKAEFSNDILIAPLLLLDNILSANQPAGGQDFIDKDLSCPHSFKMFTSVNASHQSLLHQWYRFSEQESLLKMFLSYVLRR